MKATGPQSEWGGADDRDLLVADAVVMPSRGGVSVTVVAAPSHDKQFFLVSAPVTARKA